MKTPMKISSIARINLAVVALSITAILFASVIGYLPDERFIKADARANLCESLATSATFLVSKQDFSQIDRQLDFFVKRNEDVQSAGLRRKSGEILADAGNHANSWEAGIEAENDGCYIVPIRTQDGEWGSLEIQFDPLFAGTGMIISPSLLKLILLLAPLIGLATWLHLNRILSYLDPTQVVPNRVRQTLDSFAEGVVLLDKNERIVLVNEAFADYHDSSEDELIGLKIGSLQWSTVDDEETLPWILTRKTTQTINGSTVKLQHEDRNSQRIFSVNSSPVIDEAGEFQGVMIAFADVTPLEQQRAELAETLDELQQSKDEISKQNDELRFLATRDPLTGCINRRTFFEQFDQFWTEAKSDARPLCAMMVDIDFFKSINDNFGHSMGDEVLRKTGGLLNELARPQDVVCRYGGEEFSILMPGLSLDEANEFGERIRVELSRLKFPEFTITASLGISAYSLGGADPQELLDQADKCLYVAKRNGRNQVVRYDNVPEDLVVDESKISRTKPAQSPDSSTTIPFAAVSALLSALSYRDRQTGSHSTRVSTYAALLAQRFMSPRDVYLVEVAGLLHDIGKIGVPDAILLKPGKLSREEWEVMDRHDRIGVEIISKSFKNATLTETVRCHHARFDGTRNESLPSGKDIPMGARILTIADSFDAMVSDRPYRIGMPVEDALAELRRCSGTQFDPDLAREFCKIIESGEAQLDSAVKGISTEVVLSIGEQIESIVQAADQGDREAFIALTDRLRLTAEQSQVQSVAQAATKAVDSANEDATLERLVKESYELLAVCRSIHENVAHTVDAPDRSVSDIPVD